MIEGVMVGIVKDNKDPEKMHRVLVELPTESFKSNTESYWCRIATPMAGMNRGLVILPDIGTEVVLMFSNRSNHPYIIGAVYNGGDDRPEPYHNDDEENNKRVFWSRSSHLLIFDDSKGKEKVELGTCAGTRLDVTSGNIYQSLDSSQAVITEYCDGDTKWEAGTSISIKCTDFSLEASNTIATSSSATTAMKSGGQYSSKASIANNTGATIQVNSGVTANPSPSLALPEYKHPPTS